MTLPGFDVKCWIVSHRIVPPNTLPWFAHNYNHINYHTHTHWIIIRQVFLHKNATLTFTVVFSPLCEANKAQHTKRRNLNVYTKVIPSRISPPPPKDVFLFRWLIDHTTTDYLWLLILKSLSFCQHNSCALPTTTTTIFLVPQPFCGHTDNTYHSFLNSSTTLVT